MKARMQEQVLCSKTRRSIVQAVTANVKFRKLKNEEYREIFLSKRDCVYINDFFTKWLFFEEKK